MSLRLNIRKMIAALKGEIVVPAPEDRKTYDLSKGEWGNDYNILWVTGEGNTLRLAIWCPHRVEVGDYLILRGDCVDSTTRYRVIDIDRYSNPSDMAIVTAIFDPRGYYEV